MDPVTQGLFGSGYAGSVFTSCIAYTPTAPLTIQVPAPPGHDVFTIAEYTVPNASTELPFTSTSTTALPAGALVLVSTSVPNIGVAGNAITITPAIAVAVPPVVQTVAVSSIANIVVGTVLSVDTGASQEFVTVTAVGAGTISALFTQNHAAGVTATGVINLPSGVTTTVNALLNPALPNAPITLIAQVAGVYLAGSGTPPIALASPVPLPITNPMREQGAFLAAPSNVGVPIPVVGLDNSGNVIPGNILAGSGTLPKAGDKITLASSETGPAGASTTHAKLYLVDATTGAIAQTEVPGTTPITLTELNVLDAADAVSGGVVGDPYVVVLADDGSAGTQVSAVTVTLNATINGVAVPKQTTSIAPQSAIYTATAPAPAQGYADAGGPYVAASDILCTLASCISGTAPAGGLGYWVSDGGNLALVGTGRHAVAGAVSLTGLTYDGNSNAKQIVAVDNSVTQTFPPSAESGAPIASGVFFFDPNAFGNLPLAVQDSTTGMYINFSHPQGVAYMPGGYLYLEENNHIWALDPTANGSGGLQTIAGGTLYEAEAIGQLTLTSSLSLTGATAPTGIGMIASGGLLYLADTGNSRIVSITTSGTVTPLASTVGVDKFVGLTVVGTSLVATAQSGQIWSIPTFATTPGTPVPFLLAANLGTAQDGGIGELAVGTTGLPTATTTTAQPYVVQGKAANFFGSASVPTLPYSVAPFSAAGPVFAALAQAAITGAPLSLAADTSNAAIGSPAKAAKVKAPFGIVQVPAASVGANTALTKDSFLFTDGGAVRTLVP